ncbi:TIGR04076 family protein [Alloscardovia venturai]|uniref:TIGR04076 family protein n=1 Tax=Alloscardovia venturai TaxID=1769421 RepID=A0ABW2Y5Q1_9BIFI
MVENPHDDDTFDLYTLKVEVKATDRPFVCSHHVGDYFLVCGENLIFEQTRSFSLYALAALLPLLPAKQRELSRNDWMFTDSDIACPDPHCGALFHISRLNTCEYSHSQATVVPL